MYRDEMNLPAEQQTATEQPKTATVSFVPATPLPNALEITAKRLAEVCHKHLLGPEGEAARERLHNQGFSDESIRDHVLGHYSLAAVREAFAPEQAKALGLLDERLDGAFTIPLIEGGLVKSVRFIGEGISPFEGLSGEETGGSLLFLDKARPTAQAEGVVIVSDPALAALRQAEGDKRVVCPGEPQLRAAKAEALVKARVAKAVVFARETTGDDSTSAEIRLLERAGIATFVAEGAQNDIATDSIDAWRARIRSAKSGSRWIAQRALADWSEDKPDVAKLEIIEHALAPLAFPGGQADRDRDDILALISERTGKGTRSLGRLLKSIKSRASDDEAEESEDYEATREGIFRVRHLPGGKVEREKLSNFSAKIVRCVALKDGVTLKRTLLIKALVREREVLIEVDAEDFAALAWVVPQLGPEATVGPGPVTRDHLRVAIQRLSGEIPEVVAYGHTGWVLRDGHWIYLHVGGGIGEGGPVAGITVRLESRLRRYMLPNPPSGQALIKAIKASLSMLDLAPLHVMVPLVAAVYRAVLDSTDSADFVVFLVGPTGVLKSELCVLVLQHFGPEMDRYHVPASYQDTAKSVVAKGAAIKDAVLVLDDYKEEGTANKIEATREKQAEIFRAMGNRAGYDGCRTDGELRPEKPPRSLVLSSGESIGTVQSAMARSLVDEVQQGDVNLAHLTVLQRAAREGLLAQATSAYIRWLAPRRADILKRLPDLVAERRALAMIGNEGHRRTPTTVADLYIGFELFLQFAVESGALDETRASELRKKSWNALLDLTKKQVEVQAETDPVKRFIRGLSSALGAYAHFESLQGGLPPLVNALALGWRSEVRGDRATLVPVGICVGWVNVDDLFLDLDLAISAANRVFGNQPIGLTATGLGKGLKNAGLLASVGKEGNAVRKQIRGVGRQFLYHVKLASILPSEPEEAK